MNKLLFFLTIFLFSSCSGDLIKINEVTDKTILQVIKSENKNKVIYAVKTDGHCSVLDVFAYWKMDEEDGRTEELLWIEEGIYGINKYSSNGTDVTYSLKCYPNKKMKVIVEELPPDEDGIIYCNFLGVSTIEGEKAIAQKVNVKNDGWDVLQADIEGVSYQDRTKNLIESLPTECD